RNSAKAAETPAEEIIRARGATAQDVAFDGLVRTESRDDGSNGYALVGAIDTAQEQGKQIAQRAVYMAADVGIDPFALQEGGETWLKGEISAITRMGGGGEIQASGT